MKHQHDCHVCTEAQLELLADLLMWSVCVRVNHSSVELVEQVFPHVDSLALWTSQRGQDDLLLDLLEPAEFREARLQSIKQGFQVQMACLRLLWVRAEVGGRCLPELLLEKAAVFCGQSFSVHGRVIVEALQVLKPGLSLDALVKLRVQPYLSRSCTECRPQSVLVRLFRWSLVHYGLESAPVSTL